MKKNVSKAVFKIIGVTFLLQTVCILSLKAQNKIDVAPKATTYADIVQKVGNDEMKSYGMALEAGTLTPAVKLETIPEGSGVTYYVDATNGNDSDNGTTASKAWKSIEKVNSVMFQPGDRLLFKANETWTAPIAPKINGSLSIDIDEDQDGRPENFLCPKGSGTEDAYIVIGAYGTGALPKFVGGANVNTVVAFKDQEYWDISNIDVSNIDPAFNPKNTGSTENAKLMGNLRGILVCGQSFSADGITPGGVLDGFNIHDTFIHDISGHVYWGGAPADRGYPGVYGNMHDASKRTGGIVFENWKPTTESDLTIEEKALNTKDRPISFNNILILNNVICNTSFGCITIKQWGGSGHDVVSVGDFYIAALETTSEIWNKRNNGTAENNYYDAGWHPHTNVIVTNNYVSNSKTEYGCNTIRLSSVDGGIVSNNICAGAGTCSIELDYANDIVVQYNEVYNTKKKMGGADNNGIDCDQQTSNCLVQYNYLYNNGDGFLLCGWNTFSTAVWRYNIIRNSGASDNYIALYSTKGYNCLHNNLIYSSNNAPTFVGRPGNFKVEYAANPHYFYNNIFYSTSTTTAPAIYDGTNIIYSNNCYYGEKTPLISEDANPVTENPGFTGNFTTDIEAFKISEHSPLINAGKEITYPATFGGNFINQYLYDSDFFGDSVKSGARTDIGLDEYQFTAGKGIIRGYVKDQYGQQTAGVTVKLDETPYMATTQSNGYYSFGEIPEGDYTLIASKNMYQNSIDVVQAVEAGKVTYVSLVLGENLSSVGVISGTVTVSGGVIVDNATISFIREGESFETSTNNSGNYSIEVPGFESGEYSIVVSKEGCLDAKKDILVRNGDSVTQNFILWSSDFSLSAELINESFNGFTSGDFTTNDKWNVSVGGGTITIVDDPSQPENKYLQLNKTSSGTMAVYNTTNANATGIVTVEAKVMRTTDSGTNNQLQMFSFNKTDFGTGGTIPPSTGRMATFAFNKSVNRDILTHISGAAPDAGDYELNKWDTIRIVTNLNTKTFDFYLNDMIAPILTNQPLKTTNRNAIDRFLFYGNSINIGDMCIDYFRVFTGTPKEFDNTTQVNNLVEGFANLSIYPNPATEGFYVKGLKQPTIITLTNISGKTVLNKSVSVGEFISTNQLTKGFYIAHIGTWNTKIIVH
jgi:hypothetical protein